MEIGGPKNDHVTLRSFLLLTEIVKYKVPPCGLQSGFQLFSVSVRTQGSHVSCFCRCGALLAQSSKGDQNAYLLADLLTRNHVR